MSSVRKSYDLIIKIIYIILGEIYQLVFSKCSNGVESINHAADLLTRTLTLMEKGKLFSFRPLDFFRPPAAMIHRDVNMGKTLDCDLSAWMAACSTCFLLLYIDIFLHSIPRSIKFDEIKKKNNNVNIHKTCFY